MGSFGGGLEYRMDMPGGRQRFGQGFESKAKEHCKTRNSPRFMNGMVKSTARSRSYVIVRSQMPRSAFCNGKDSYSKLQ